MNAVDVTSLQQQVKIMQEELGKNAVQLNTSNNANKSLDKQVVRYKEQIQKMETSKVSALVPSETSTLSVTNPSVQV